MYYNNNQRFHTKDQDSTVGFNGRVCSLARYAGFWFNECTWANLNGRWLPGSNSLESMYWIEWPQNQRVSLYKISMKIRRK